MKKSILRLRLFDSAETSSKKPFSPRLLKVLKGSLDKKILIDLHCKGYPYFKLLDRKFYIVYH